MPAEQLKMFMTGPEIKAYAKPGSGEYLSSDTDENTGAVIPDKLYARKANEAARTGLADLISAKGVQNPVRLMHFGPNATGHQWSGDGLPLANTVQIADGHHRVAVSVLHPKQFVPVIHHEYSAPVANDYPELDSRFR